MSTYADLIERLQAPYPSTADKLERFLANRRREKKGE